MWTRTFYLISLSIIKERSSSQGTATFFLSTAFTKTIGIDPSESMIDIAKSSLAKDETGLSSKLSFEIGTADSLPFIKDESVDLVTSATAAHWFPETWWKEVGR
jgi:trans-aconitate 3-methyltransferase